jgi:ribosomal protein S27AE
MPSRVTEALPTFVELAFLREEQSDVIDALHRAFNRQELLTHTGVLLFKKMPGADDVVLEEFVRSNQDRPWGLELPDCPSCHTSMFMRANRMEDGKHCRIRCGRCHSYSKMNIPRPAFVVPCVASYLESYSYFTIPFPPPADIWSQLEWVEKTFISD